MGLTVRPALEKTLPGMAERTTFLPESVAVKGL